MNTRKLFLIDGIGAILSAFLLGVVLVQLESIFGIPRQALFILAALPCILAIYDFYCYLNVQENFSFSLRVIASINLWYCCLSIGFAFYHYQKLTCLGWIYIVGEIIIVAALARLELKTANKLVAEK